MNSETQILNNAHLVVVRDAVERRKANGMLENPPQLRVVVYDLETNTALVEPISFAAAKALAPEKFKAAAEKLRKARLAPGAVVDAPCKLAREVAKRLG